MEERRCHFTICLQKKKEVYIHSTATDTCWLALQLCCPLTRIPKRIQWRRYESSKCSKSGIHLVSYKFASLISFWLTVIEMEPLLVALGAVVGWPFTEVVRIACWLHNLQSYASRSATDLWRRWLTEWKQEAVLMKIILSLIEKLLIEDYCIRWRGRKENIVIISSWMTAFESQSQFSDTIIRWRRVISFSASPSFSNCVISVLTCTRRQLFEMPNTNEHLN